MADAPLHELIYSSAARQPFSEAALKTLLVKARARNAPLGLTGLLLHENGSFLQVLEGTQQAVTELYERLCKDPRHHRLVRIYEGEIAPRRFGDWSMGFASITPRAAKDLDGYNDFFFRYRETTEVPPADVAQRVLAAFREGRWHAYVDK
jgi:hypothetical protein